MFDSINLPYKRDCATFLFNSRNYIIDWFVLLKRSLYDEYALKMLTSRMNVKMEKVTLLLRLSVSLEEWSWSTQSTAFIKWFYAIIGAVSQQLVNELVTLKEFHARLKCQSHPIISSSLLMPFVTVSHLYFIEAAVLSQYSENISLIKVTEFTLWSISNDTITCISIFAVIELFTGDIDIGEHIDMKYCRYVHLHPHVDPHPISLICIGIAELVQYRFSVYCRLRRTHRISTTISVLKP